MKKTKKDEKNIMITIGLYGCSEVGKKTIIFKYLKKVLLTQKRFR